MKSVPTSNKKTQSSTDSNLPNIQVETTLPYLVISPKIMKWKSYIEIRIKIMTLINAVFIKTLKIKLITKNKQKQRMEIFTMCLRIILTEKLCPIMLLVCQTWKVPKIVFQYANWHLYSQSNCTYLFVFIKKYIFCKIVSCLTLFRVKLISFCYNLNQPNKKFLIPQHFLFS